MVNLANITTQKCIRCSCRRMIEIHVKAITFGTFSDQLIMLAPLRWNFNIYIYIYIDIATKIIFKRQPPAFVVEFLLERSHEFYYRNRKCFNVQNCPFRALTEYRLFQITNSLILNKHAKTVQLFSTINLF